MLIKVDKKDLSNTHTPIFDYCRKLIKDGVSPETKLEVYNGDMLCLTVHGIGKGAELTVCDVNFEKYRERRKRNPK